MSNSPFLKHFQDLGDLKNKLQAKAANQQLPFFPETAGIESGKFLFLFDSNGFETRSIKFKFSNLIKMPNLSTYFDSPLWSGEVILHLSHFTNQEVTVTLQYLGDHDLIVRQSNIFPNSPAADIAVVNELVEVCRKIKSTEISKIDPLNALTLAVEERQSPVKTKIYAILRGYKIIGALSLFQQLASSIGGRANLEYVVIRRSQIHKTIVCNLSTSELAGWINEVISDSTMINANKSSNLELQIRLSYRFQNGDVISLINSISNQPGILCFFINGRNTPKHTVTRISSKFKKSQHSLLPDFLSGSHQSKIQKEQKLISENLPKLSSIILEILPHDHVSDITKATTLENLNAQGVVELLNI